MLIKKKLPDDIFENKNVLDIGCGRSKLEGSTGIDQTAYPGVDIVADLNDSLPFESESFDVVYANQVLEHIENMINLVYEVHRVLRTGGIFLAHVPYFRSVWAHTDPTHLRSFSIRTMDYFVKGTWIHDNYRFRDEGFSSIEIFIDNDYPATFLRKVFTTMALRDPWKFENSALSFFYPFEQLTYLLSK